MGNHLQLIPGNGRSYRISRQRKSGLMAQQGGRRDAMKGAGQGAVGERGCFRKGQELQGRGTLSDGPAALLPGAEGGMGFKRQGRSERLRKAGRGGCGVWGKEGEANGGVAGLGDWGGGVAFDDKKQKL